MLKDVDNNNYAIEKEISTYLSKCLKKATGKGPQFVKVFLEDSYVMAVLYNILVEAELRLTQTAEGCNHVRFNRHKIFECYHEIGEEVIPNITGRKVIDSFEDITPQTNTAIMVWLFEN